MIELGPLRKNKINLADYDFESDIRNRILLAELSERDLEILEEILYSPIRFPVKRLSQNLELSIEEIQPTLEKLGASGLFELDGEMMVVNKDVRKYFESQVVKFEEDFTPGMEFLQSLLKNVPIHILPSWYQIPRTSNNIFNSLVEKFLLTPQVFERYLMELNLGDEKLNGIAQDVFSSTDLAIPSSEIRERYGLSLEEFEEHILHLEFNFVCCLAYRKDGDHWIEVVTPFYEWRCYLEHMRNAEPTTIPTDANIKKRRPGDFSFIEDMTALVRLTKEKPIATQETSFGTLPEKGTLLELKSLLPDFDTDEEFFLSYVAKMIRKMILLNLVSIDNETLNPLEEANFWLTLSTEKQALASYKNHYVALITNADSSTKLFNERNIRELEKSIAKILNVGWISFDDFMKGVTIPLSIDSKVELRKVGRSWKYTLPAYTDEEKKLIETVVMDWLFEAGLIRLGTLDGQLCFCITDLGKKLFSE